MRGDVFTGWYELAGKFPPSVNTTDPADMLKPHETPSCYGVDCTKDGFLKTGSIVSGSTRPLTTKTIGTSTFSWYYDKVWLASGSKLTYGAKYYDDVLVPQGFGKVFAEDSIVGFFPVFNSGMWVFTNIGSQFMGGADQEEGKSKLEQLVPELYVTTGKATSAIVLDEIPYCANSKGVWSYKSGAVTELTRPVRYILGSFGTQPALTADFQRKFIIGASSFVIDTASGKLFDYGTAGFQFTSRTMVADDYRPFAIGDIGFSILFDPADTTDAVISWQTKTEDDDWYDETDIQIPFGTGTKTFITTRSSNPTSTVRKFAMRLTGLSSNLWIRSIVMNMANFATSDFGA